MRKITTAFVIAAQIHQSVWAGEKIIQYDSKKPLVLDLEDKSNPDVFKVYVEDIESGKKALLNVPKTSKKYFYSGFFILRLNPEKTNGQAKFINKKGEDIIVIDQADLKNQRLRLFPTEKEFRAYEDFYKAEIDKQRKEAEKIKLAEEKRKRDEAEKARIAEEKRLLELVKQQKLDEERKAAEIARLEAMRRQQEKQQEEERLQKELLAAQQREEMKRQLEMMSKAEKEKRARKAEQMAQEALKLFKAEKFEEAEDKFKEAIAFDPSNNKFYFQLGVAQYKNEKYQDSLVSLSMAETGDFSAAEKYYYTGLSLMKLKEYDKAIKEFRATRDENDKQLSPIAAFFSANLHYQKEEFTEAKDNIDYVLDNSSDPQMDRQAEDLLELIENIETFKENASKAYKLVLTGGPSYDSNVLSQPTSAATNAASLRLNYGVTFEYRPVYNYFHELFFDLAINDMYSMNKDVQTADAQVMTLTVPYKWKTKLGTKAFVLGVTPGYDIINLDVDGDGTRTAIVNSSYVKLDTSIFMSKDWMSAYNLESRSDKSLLTATSTDDEQTASKMTIGTSQTYFLDPKNTKSVTGDLTLTQNTAQGKNNTYTKTELGCTYGFPSYWETNANAKLSLASSTYPDRDDSRKDTVTSLNLAANKTINKKLSTSLSLGLSQSSSNVDSYNYSKMTLSNTYTWTGLF